ncbi:hypothetical protein D3C77_480060 [compost metagenome]
MHGAAVLAQGLEVVHALAQAFEPVHGWQGRSRQGVKLRQGLLQCFDPAQATATGTGKLPALVLQVPEGTAGDFHLGTDGGALALELKVVDVIERSDDAVAEAETDDEIFKVRRAYQHHRLVDAVVGNAQGYLFSQRCAGLAVIGQVVVVIAVAGRGRSQEYRRRAGRRFCTH